ncbi:MAG TPA: prepilin-type N-terminal cleavage/methylation domain-containing protein [Candidatus Portnoybacteria bacterium]|nr:prepilin-type N-terminal cleavage/methylation domain-containing protein [Candidatus Portnoybacteria bacterium]
MIGNNNYRKNGFTLVETMVTISIFTLITLSITSLFLTITKAHHQGLAMEEINQESQIILERIEKETRMAKFNLATNSLPQTLLTLPITTNTSDNVTYTFNSAAKTIERGSQTINSNKVEITQGKFYIVNDPSNNQPYVTIKFQISDTNYPNIKKIVQATISLRSGSAY